MCVDTTTIRNNCVNHSDYLEVNNLVFGLPVVTEAMGREFLGGNLSKYNSTSLLRLKALINYSLVSSSLS